jgi:hypothetical protein
MSYLRGLLTRNQIKTLMDPTKAAAPVTTVAAQPPIAATAPASAVVSAAAPTPASPRYGIDRATPALPADIQQFFRRAPRRRRALSAGDLGAARINLPTTRPGST